MLIIIGILSLVALIYRKSKGRENKAVIGKC
jgi:hypothetical protein